MHQEMIGGVILIILGVTAILWVKKNPEKGRDVFFWDYRGYIGGLGLIVGGLMLLWRVAQKFL